jgi:hypothetical protein
VIYPIADVPPVSSGPLKIRFFRKDEPFLQDVYVLEGGEDLSDPIPTLKPQVVKTAKKKPTTAKAVAAAEDKAEAEADEHDEHDDEDKAIAAAAQASVLVDGSGTSESNGNVGNGKPAGLSTLLQEASSLAQALSTRTAELVADQQRLNQLLLNFFDRVVTKVTLRGEVLITRKVTQEEYEEDGETKTREQVEERVEGVRGKKIPLPVLQRLLRAVNASIQKANNAKN